VALCEQQHDVIQKAIGSVGLIHGGLEPKQWKDPNLWKDVLKKNRVIVSTPQVLLDAVSHGYINLGLEIGLLVFDEAHHANDDHPMNCIMRSFYFDLPSRLPTSASSHGPVRERPIILGLTASPMFGGNVAEAFRWISVLHVGFLSPKF
jgi:endoribonuclease Dicer